MISRKKVFSHIVISPFIASLVIMPLAPVWAAESQISDKTPNVPLVVQETVVNDNDEGV